MAYKEVFPITEGSLPRKDFVMDTSAELDSLPACGAGSKAIDTEGGVVYMKNASDEWVVLCQMNRGETPPMDALPLNVKIETTSDIFSNSFDASNIKFPDNINEIIEQAAAGQKLNILLVKNRHTDNEYVNEYENDILTAVQYNARYQFNKSNNNEVHRLDVKFVSPESNGFYWTNIVYDTMNEEVYIEAYNILGDSVSE